MKCYVAIVSLTHHTKWKWPRTLIANCCAIKRISRWHGITRNRQKWSNAFDTNTLCICEFNALDDARRVWQFIRFIYRLVDNLPVATRIYYPETKEIQFEHGYRLGQVDKDNVYINNHLKFILSYHKHTEWVIYSICICFQITITTFFSLAVPEISIEWLALKWKRCQWIWVKLNLRETHAISRMHPDPKL